MKDHFIAPRVIQILVGFSAALVIAGSAEARSRTAATPTPTPAGGRTPARLIVQRSANFGTNLVVRLVVDGKRVADIPRNQHYGGLLPPGRHTIVVLSLPNIEFRRPTSIVLTAKPGKVYIFTAAWDSDRLVLRPSDLYSPTQRVNPR
jgi:hypothetical protein